MSFRMVRNTFEIIQNKITISLPTVFYFLKGPLANLPMVAYEIVVVHAASAPPRTPFGTR